MTIVLHCDGEFNLSPRARYVDGQRVVCDWFDAKTVVVRLLNIAADKWGVEGGRSYYIITENAENWVYFKPLISDDDLRAWCLTHIASWNRKIDIYVRNKNPWIPKHILVGPLHYVLDLWPRDIEITEGHNATEVEDFEGEEFETTLLEFAENDDPEDRAIGDEESMVDSEETEDHEAELMVEDGEDVPRLGVIMVFKTIAEIKQAIQEHDIKTEKRFIFERNDERGLYVRCREEGCPWRLEATVMKYEMTFQVKVYCATHKCGEIVPFQGSEVLLPIGAYPEEGYVFIDDEMMNDVEMDLVQELLYLTDDACTLPPIQNQVEERTCIVGLEDVLLQATQTTLDILERCGPPTSQTKEMDQFTSKNPPNWCILSSVLLSPRTTTIVL